MQLLWIVAHTLMGGGIGNIVHTEFIAGNDEFGNILDVLTVIWYFAGLPIAIVQWLLLVRLVPKVATRWAVGTVIGWYLGLYPEVFLWLLLPTPFDYLGDASSSASLMTQTPIRFVSLGVWQWAALRLQVIGSSQWIYVSVLGGCAVFAAAAFFTFLGLPATTAGLVGWAGYGIITWHLFVKKISRLPQKRT